MKAQSLLRHVPVRARRVAAVGFGIALLSGLLQPMPSSAHEPVPPHPLTADIVNKLIADAGCGSGTGIAENTALPSPDRKVGGSGNRFIGAARNGADNTSTIAIWANADNDPKELTLDVSGQHNVVDGDAVSRSHLKVSASQSLFRHATEYGNRSASGKNAFDLSGQNNCFNLEPDLVPRNSDLGTPAGAFPRAPDGFPFEEQFDPDGDGNVLEHFDPVAGPAGQDFAASVPAASYRQCRVGSSSNIAPPMLCDTSSGKLTGDVQGTDIPPGLYYVEGEVLISASNQFADVTIVSGKQLKVNGSVQGGEVGESNVFNPFFRDLLFASQWDLANKTANTDKAEDALKIEGSKSQFQGIIVAVNGRTELAGEQNRFTCPVMGDRVRLNGSKLFVSGHACGRAGLTIVKTPDGVDGTVPDGVINAGDLATFTITVTNSGSAPANNVTVTDTLPGTGWTENPDTLCTIAGGNALTCNVGTLAAGASFTVTLQRATSAAECTGAGGAGVKLDNGSETAAAGDDALASATDIPQVNDPGLIILRCGALRILKKSTKSGNPLVKNAGAVFEISSILTLPTVKDNNNPNGTFVDASEVIGEVCVENMAPGDYTINELTPPPGYGDASETNVFARVVAGTNCTTNIPTDLDSAVFINPPLVDIQVRFRDGGSGETSLVEPLACNNVGGNSSNTNTTGWDNTLTVLGIPIDPSPQTVTCVFAIDP